MNGKKLIVFPTEAQIKYIDGAETDSEIYILVRDREEMSETKNNRCVIVPDNHKAIEKIRRLGTDVEVLCCHEEGLYWLKNFGNRKWKYQFSTEIFEMLTKDKFKDYLSEHGILNAGYSKGTAGIEAYPFVIKPVMGFGGIGVKKINDLSELERYLGEGNKKSIDAKLKPYQDRYFHLSDNFFIVERYIPGRFYRTPFVILENTVKYLFPIMGKDTTCREGSDYHWTDFAYGEKEREAAPILVPILEKLSELFELEDGVYVAEFIISDKGAVYLLEFSPRQTSGRIAGMIKLAAGIDLEKLAVDIFLSRAGSRPQPRYRDIRMRIERNGGRADENLYEMIDSQEEKSVYGDRIKTVYYGRKSE